MIIDSTYTDKRNEELINNLVGSKYSLWQSIKLKGVGSKRMMIEEASKHFSNQLNLISDVNYANIELRPNGILLHINKGLNNFTWAVPIYKLHIYRTNSFSIHADGKFIRFKNNKLLKENKLFIDKLLDFKIENNKKYTIPHD